MKFLFGIAFISSVSIANITPGVLTAHRYHLHRVASVPYPSPSLRSTGWKFISTIFIRTICKMIFDIRDSVITFRYWCHKGADLFVSFWSSSVFMVCLLEPERLGTGICITLMPVDSQNGSNKRPHTLGPRPMQQVLYVSVDFISVTSDICCKQILMVRVLTFAKFCHVFRYYTIRKIPSLFAAMYHSKTESCG